MLFLCTNKGLASIHAAQYHNQRFLTVHAETHLKGTKDTPLGSLSVNGRLTVLGLVGLEGVIACVYSGICRV